MRYELNLYTWSVLTDFGLRRSCHGLDQGRPASTHRATYLVRTRPRFALVCTNIEKHKGRLVYCFCFKIGESYFPNIFSANKLDILCSIDPNMLCLLNCIIETIQVTTACDQWAVSWPACRWGDPVSNPEPGHVRFLVNKVSLKQVSPRETVGSPVSVALLVLHINFIPNGITSREAW